MYDFLSSGHVTCLKEVPSPSIALTHLRSLAALLHSPANLWEVSVGGRASVQLKHSRGWVRSPSLQADSQKVHEAVVGWERGSKKLLCIVHKVQLLHCT